MPSSAGKKKNDTDRIESEDWPAAISRWSLEICQPETGHHARTHVQHLYRLTLIHCAYLFFFFFNDTATPEISPLSLPDALPIYYQDETQSRPGPRRHLLLRRIFPPGGLNRSEEHTSELQSLRHLVCRLLLE